MNLRFPERPDLKGTFLLCAFLFAWPAQPSMYDNPLLTHLKIYPQLGDCLKWTLTQAVVKGSFSRTEGGRSFLGEGTMGGKVYRVYEVDGTSFVEKHYRKTSSIKNDRTTLSLLGKILDGMAEASDVRVVKVLETNWEDKILKLEDVRGETVEAVFSRVKDEETKAELLKFWKSRLELVKHSALVMKEILRKREWGELTDIEEGNHASELPSLVFQYTLKDDEEKTTFSVWINVENVLVDEKGNLVIIDPY